VKSEEIKRITYQVFFRPVRFQVRIEKIERVKSEECEKSEESEN
jgi:hypothetical protein